MAGWPPDRPAVGAAHGCSRKRLQIFVGREPRHHRTALPAQGCIAPQPQGRGGGIQFPRDRKSTRLNSSHGYISYAVFCLKKKNTSTLTSFMMKRNPKNIVKLPLYTQ